MKKSQMKKSQMRKSLMSTHLHYAAYKPLLLKSPNMLKGNTVRFILESVNHIKLGNNNNFAETDLLSGPGVTGIPSCDD